MQTKICLSVYGEMYIIDPSRVLYMQADDHYTHVYYSSGNYFMVPFGLSKVEAVVSEHLGEKPFLVRLGRKYIVNTHRVFHVNFMKQVLQLSDDSGTNHSLRIPKPVLRGLMQILDWGKSDSAGADDTPPEL